MAGGYAMSSRVANALTIAPAQILGLALAAGLGLTACVTPIRHAECANAGASILGSTGIYGPLGLMKSDEQVACDRRLDYVNSNPQQPPDVTSAVRRGTVFVGMPSAAVHASFGSPNHVKSASNGTEHWIYGYRTRHGFRTLGVIEFRDGRVAYWKAWR